MFDALRAALGALRVEVIKPVYAPPFPEEPA
jgi:hypothetical protein